MSHNFECLVKYNNFNYSIGVNEDINTISFVNLYDKIKRMIKNVFDEDIDFKTHLFELFDVKFDDYVIIDRNKEISNLSRIRVSLKPQNYPKINSELESVMAQTYERDEDKGFQHSGEKRHFHASNCESTEND